MKFVFISNTLTGAKRLQVQKDRKALPLLVTEIYVGGCSDDRVYPGGLCAVHPLPRFLEVMKETLSATSKMNVMACPTEETSQSSCIWIGNFAFARHLSAKGK